MAAQHPEDFVHSFRQRFLIYVLPATSVSIVGCGVWYTLETWGLN